MEPYQFSTTVQIAIGSGIADDLKVWWMSLVTVSMVVFACVFGSAVAGMLVTQFLPSKHTSAETKEVVRLGMGLVTTTVALALGLLIASAKSFYDTQSSEMTQLAEKWYCSTACWRITDRKRLRLEPI